MTMSHDIFPRRDALFWNFVDTFLYLVSQSPKKEQKWAYTGIFKPTRKMFKLAYYQC